MAPFALAWSESILDALYDWIELELACGGVEQAEAIDQPATAAEHYFFVEHVPPVLAGNDEPACPAAGVGDSESSVGLAPKEIHVIGDGVASVVFQGSYKKAPLSLHGRKHLAVACRRLSVGDEHICRIAQGKAEAFIDIGGPTAATFAGCGASPEKQYQN
jgi:hypothetical protein